MSDGTGTGDAAAAAAAAASAAAAAAAAQKPWYDGKADAETVGYFKNRGWDTKDAVTVAIEASKAHREAEKFIGAPAAELLRLPKDANDPAWRSVYQRLGAPENPQGYDLSGVKFTDGTALTEDFAKVVANAAFNAHVPKDAAPAFARELVKYMEANDAAEAAQEASKLAVEKDTLKKNWGMHENANTLLAKNTAGKLGVTEAELNALEKVVGFARVMEMFRNIGQKTGEDALIRNTGGGGGMQTAEQAKDKLAALMRDKEWTKKLMNGDPAAKYEEDQLNRQILGVA